MFGNEAATAQPTRRTGLDLLPRQGSRHMVALDVSDFVRRAWHGHVNEHRNEPERAAPTALRNIARVLRGRQPSHVLMAGEGMGSARKQLFAGYKAGRPEKPEGLVLSEARVEQALAAAGTPLARFAGLEADDVLHAGMLVARDNALPVVVVTRDKDALALVSDSNRVVVWRDAEEVYDEHAVMAKWDVAPQRFTELLAIMGDDTDGVPGGARLGKVAGAKILAGSAGRSLEALLAEGGYHWVPSTWRKKWLASLEQIRLSYELVQLRGAAVASRVFLDDLEVVPLRVAESLMRSADELGRDNSDGGAW